MRCNPPAIRIPRLVLLALLGIAAIPGTGVAGEDPQAEQERRHLENEARWQQEQFHRDMEDRARAQVEALRSQEDAIRRMEATQARMDASARQQAQLAADQARMDSYPSYTYIPAIRPSAPDAATNVIAPVAPTFAPAAPEVRATPDRAPNDDAVSGMIFAPLSDRLKRYFGTQSGVLVASAGGRAPFDLQDGDVIISIDGRVPADGPHAERILRSYQPGEHARLRVQRDRRVIELNATAPD